MNEKSTESITKAFDDVKQNEMCSFLKQNKETTYCKAITKKGSLCINSSNCSVHKNQHSNQCIVCFENTNKPFKLKCKHTVCDDCILKWAAKCQVYLSCPMCRRDCSDEWSELCKQDLKYRDTLVKFERALHIKFAHIIDVYNTSDLDMGEFLRASHAHDLLTEKMFVFMLSKPAIIASRLQFYDYVRRRMIDFYNNDKFRSPNYTKAGKMFKAFNEKYYDYDKETLKI